MPTAHQSRIRYSVFLHTIIALIILILPILSGVHAQEGDLIAPEEINGVAIYIPFNVPIVVDGDLSDWATIPVQTVERGTQTSLNPKENGSFTFSVAADARNLYVTMTMPDQNIVAGQHGTSFWNEDSLEFFVNLSGNLSATSYTDGIFQININAADIGNTDPAALTITGSGSSAAKVTGFVFKTDNGWGFEAALDITPFITPSLNLEIGFQAQANGATEHDRDVKLIWSLADTGDNSWQNPSVFGSGLFFAVGQTDIPQPSVRTEEVEDAEVAVQALSLNQVGYTPNAPKFAMLADEGTSRKTWSLIDAASGEVLKVGISSTPIVDKASGDTIHRADFSDFTTPGIYRLVMDGIASPEFTIGNDIYSTLRVDALRFFSLNRVGIELAPDWAGEWARAAGHVTDNAVTCYAGEDADGKTWEGCGYTLDAGRGWYDAGDYGKYVVNGGIAVWTLHNLYERFPTAFPDGALTIPESGNNVPDILDEARWEMEFLLGMQVPEGEDLAGMVHHKLHDLEWSGIPLLPPTEYDNNNPTTGRFVYPPTTAATLNLAATAAQCARLWGAYDADFSATCLASAERAWQAALSHPAMFIGRTPGAGGGDYPDSIVSDEFFWAAAELYATTGKQEYLDYLLDSTHWVVFAGQLNSNTSAMYWGDVSALGTISLLTAPTGLSTDQIEKLQGQIIATADRYLEQIAAEGYRVPIPSPNGYVWGSNSGVLNNALVMALAHDFTEDSRYLDGVTASMDYLLGMNALQRSFVSGYGATALEHPHHRFWGNTGDFPAPPPGALAGGPNSAPSDPPASVDEILSQSAPKRYIDDIGSYSTNEVAINWNAPLAWVATYLDITLNQ